MCDPVDTVAVYRASAKIHRSVGLDVTTQVTMDVGLFMERFCFDLHKPVLGFAEPQSPVFPPGAEFEVGDGGFHICSLALACWQPDRAG